MRAMVLSLVACACGAAQRVPAPPTTAMVAAGDVQLYVRVAGPATGEVVLIIHGGPGLSHDYLLGIEEVLPAGARLVSYDQRACGKSSPARSFTLPEMLSDIDAIR